MSDNFIIEDFPMSEVEFEKRYNTEQACIDYLFKRKWPDGFCCQKCGHETGDAGKLARQLLREIDSLWTFLDHKGVEPTNNRAEGALRFAVLWRKRSMGTQSAKGNRWVERILSLKETCRLRSKSTFQVLLDCLRATSPPLPRISLGSETATSSAYPVNTYENYAMIDSKYWIYPCNMSSYVYDKAYFSFAVEPSDDLNFGFSNNSFIFCAKSSQSPL